MARNPSNPIGREADDKLKEMRKVQGGCAFFPRQRQKEGVARIFQKLYFFFSFVYFLYLYFVLVVFEFESPRWLRLLSEAKTKRRCSAFISKVVFLFSFFVFVFCISGIWIWKSREAVCVSFRRKRQKEHVARLSHKFKQHCVAIGANDWVSVASRILHKSCCVYNAFVLKPQCRCNPSTFFCSAKLLQKPPQLVTEVPPWNIDCAFCSLVACSSCKTFALDQIRNPSDQKC